MVHAIHTKGWIQILSLSFFISLPLNNKQNISTYYYLSFTQNKIKLAVNISPNMAEAIMSFGTIIKPNAHTSCLRTTRLDLNSLSSKSLRQYYSSSGFSNGCQKIEGSKNRRAEIQKMKALPDLTLMAVLVEHMEGQRDMITHKSIWHLSDVAMKNVYTFYIMFTCWGCCFFGSTKDPYYDSEQYRKDGGDGTGHWVYEKQEDIEESARAALWREELIEEIEQKVGGLRELEEAGKKEEELVR